MNLHEYQAKSLFERYHLPVPAGEVASSVEEAIQVWDQLGTSEVVVKAQVHAGGRGKAGGVKIISDKETFKEYVNSQLGSRLVTIQTDEHGQPVNQVLVAAPSDIASELYLSLIVDRARQRIVIMASTEGGVDIEAVAEETPEKIISTAIDPLVGVMPFQCRDLAFQLGFKGDQIKQFTHILTALGKLFVENDLSQAEINPLVITGEGDLLCLDAKVNIDENALFRQKDLREMRDVSQEDERENRAQQSELNYIALDGDIGCMVNGAGLAMATMDLIKLKGGNPANFLDVGGGATKERVTEAFKIILSDEKVKAVLVNIFGGIVRCDIIAEGIIGAVEEVGIEVPVVVRLEGNNAELGAEKLEKSGLNIIAAKGFAEAAEQVVACAGGEK
jgi:succinyl-CoA synthetase beta subunit